MRRQVGLALAVKKAVDRTVGLGLLALTSPILITAVVATRLSLGRAAMFSQLRPGLNGKPFRIYKIKTMTDAVDAEGRLLADEERLTKLGRVLRATSIDELPQLWNVVRGDLSLVGPRPLLMEYLPRYSAEQARRHDVLPGMTGWAQIHGRNSVSWERKFELDVWYVDHWSLTLDCRIIAASILPIVLRRGVSSVAHATMPVFMGTPAADGPNDANT